MKEIPMISSSLKTKNLIDLNKIHNEWELDCVIDDLRLDKTSLDIPKLHAKYLRYYDLAKSVLRDQESEFTLLFRKRTSWYEGELTKQEMDLLGWDYDPYQGKLVRTKTQKDYYLKTDELLLSAQKEIDYSRNIVDTIKEIIDNIKFRPNTIKNIITWRQFQAGS